MGPRRIDYKTAENNRHFIVTIPYFMFHLSTLIYLSVSDVVAVLVAVAVAVAAFNEPLVGDLNSGGHFSMNESYDQ